MITLHANQSIQFIINRTIIWHEITLVHCIEIWLSLPKCDVQWTLKKQSWCLFTVHTFLRFLSTETKDKKIIYWWENAAEWPSKQVITGPWCDWWLHNIISLTAARFNKHGLHHHQPTAGSRMENVKQPTLLSLTRYLWRYLCSLYLYIYLWLLWI